MVGEEQVQRFPLLRIPARPGGVSSLTGKGDGGLTLLTRPCSGGRQVRQQPGLLACLRKRRLGLSHEPGGRRGGSWSARGGVR